MQSFVASVLIFYGLWKSKKKTLFHIQQLRSCDLRYDHYLEPVLPYYEAEDDFVGTRSTSRSYQYLLICGKT